MSLHIYSKHIYNMILSCALNVKKTVLVGARQKLCVQKIRSELTET